MRNNAQEHILRMDGMVKLFVAFLLCCSSTAVMGQESVSEIEKLKKQIAEQQRQLEEMKSMLEQQQKALERLSIGIAQQASTPEPKQVKAETLAPGSSVKNEKEAPAAPLSFRVGGADFTPGGFLDLSAVWRSTNVGSGVATSFGSIPANNTPAGRLSEWRFSAYNSRLTLKVTEHPLANKDVLATGYVEMDFAGIAPSTIYSTSNANTLRLRQVWGSVQYKKFEIMGGQAWTLMTPNRVGTSPVPAEVFLGLQQDSAYLAGLVWARQAQVRATYRATSHWTAAVSMENPQQYVTNATLLPTDFSLQFDNNSGNSSVPNARPDFIAKVAFDAKPAGRTMHFEVAGLSREFRTLAPGNVRHSAQGLGGSFNMVVEPIKNLRWIMTSFFSSGGGRYIMGMGPDAVVGPDGSISPVHSIAGIAGLEYQFLRNSQAFAYYSGAYFRRNYIAIAPENYVGFGYPGSSSSANRQIQEVTLGLVQTYWKNPNYGSLQTFSQYSYLTRSPWYVAPASESTMHTHMIFTGMRFTLP
jgi:hypothetical protein